MAVFLASSTRAAVSDADSPRMFPRMPLVELDWGAPAGARAAATALLMSTGGARSSLSYGGAC